MGLRFCTTDAPFPLYEIDDEPMLRCPVQFITPASLEALTDYGFYQAGFLQNAGGVNDQPIRYIQQMQVIAGVLDEAVRTRQTKMRRLSR